ncbi:hypothetical protein J6590_088394 [Homalodisca vitripennis]|nr:hypothetical protein J6590_088394 [Homalodisca vitripennis]
MFAQRSPTDPHPVASCVESGQLILKRWNNIRDQWVKWKKKEKDSKKSGLEPQN